MPYYNVAHAGDRRWPYDIGLSFDPVACPIGFAEGIGQGAGAITLSVDEALGESWRRHFTNARGEWLLPYLEDLRRGVPLPEEAIRAQYQAIHGRELPTSTLWD